MFIHILYIRHVDAASILLSATDEGRRRESLADIWQSPDLHEWFNVFIYHCNVQGRALNQITK